MYDICSNVASGSNDQKGGQKGLNRSAPSPADRRKFLKTAAASTAGAWGIAAGLGLSGLDFQTNKVFAVQEIKKPLFKISPPHENLWVNSGSGKAPRL